MNRLTVKRIRMGRKLWRKALLLMASICIAMIVNTTQINTIENVESGKVSCVKCGDRTKRDLNEEQVDSLSMPTVMSTSNMKTEVKGRMSSSREIFDEYEYYLKLDGFQVQSHENVSQKYSTSSEILEEDLFENVDIPDKSKEMIADTLPEVVITYNELGIENDVETRRNVENSTESGDGFEIPFESKFETNVESELSVETEIETQIEEMHVQPVETNYYEISQEIYTSYEVNGKIYNFTEYEIDLICCAVQHEVGSSANFYPDSDFDEIQQSMTRVIVNRIGRKGFRDSVEGVLTQSGQFMALSKLKRFDPKEEATRKNVMAVLNGEDNLSSDLIFEMSFKNTNVEESLQKMANMLGETIRPTLTAISAEGRLLIFAEIVE